MKLNHNKISCIKLAHLLYLPVPLFFVENFKLTLRSYEREPSNFVRSDVFRNSDDKKKSFGSIE